MRHRSRKTALVTLAAVALLATTIPVNAHPVHDFGGVFTDALKGRNYTGVVDHISPGGVPMEAISDARCIDGIAAGLFPCHRVDLAAFVPLPDLESTFLNDIWGWEDPETGMQLAIVGTFEGTAFVDVTNATTPVYLGTLGSAIPNDFGNIWGDIRVYQNTAYIVAEALDFTTYDPAAGTIEGFGVQVVDLTQFRGATEPIEDIQLVNHITDVTQSHNVSVNEETGRLYVVGAFAGLGPEVASCHVEAPPGVPVLNGSGGALIYDLTDPHSPDFLGCVTTDVYNHDIQCVAYRGPDEEYQEREICIGSDEHSLAIYDVTDAAAPVELSRATYLPEGTDPFDYYTHQGWLTADQRYFFLGDEVDELSGVAPERTTYIWDLADLDEPQLIGVHTDGNTSIDHNMFVHDGLLYQSNYTSGLWIYDSWKVEQGRVTMRGYFDVFPADDRTDFFGTWGNYPYFGDGKVIVTSSDEGLFILNSRATSADNEVDKSRGKKNPRAR